MHSVTRTIFPVFAFRVMHRVILCSSIHWNVQLATWQMVHLPSCQLHISVNRTAQIYLELHFCVELHTKKALRTSGGICKRWFVWEAVVIDKQTFQLWIFCCSGMLVFEYWIYCSDFVLCAPMFHLLHCFLNPLYPVQCKFIANYSGGGNVNSDSAFWHLRFA